MKKEKIKKEKIKKEKDKKPNKFIETIKKKWLVNTSKTLLLIAIIVAIFIGINIIIQSLELTPLDFTQEKLFTLTDESKEKVRNIDKNVNIYFIGYSEEDTNFALAKQYKNVNEKINVERIDINNRPDIASKYQIESGTEAILVECGEKYKVLTENDLVTYDTMTYETISVAEEKLTSSILSVITDKLPKIYFLKGYSEFGLNSDLNYLNAFLENEINEIEELDILTVGKVPDDCDTLVILSPEKDFDDIATKAIKDYINSGRNILWLNAAISKKIDLTNVNSILELYGIKPFELGIIRETDSGKMMTSQPDLIRPDIEYSEITKNLINTVGVVFVNATKINVDEDKLEELKVEKTELLQASESSYFRTDFTIQSDAIAKNEAKGPFLVGAEFDKTISDNNEEKKSKLVIYGENYFISDYPIMQNSQYPGIQLSYNRNLILDSMAYLVDRPEDVTARKNTGTVTYTATEEQDTIVKIIIFTVPILIIIVGIIVWQVRRRKK